MQGCTRKSSGLQERKAEGKRPRQVGHYLGGMQGRVSGCPGPFPASHLGIAWHASLQMRLSKEEAMKPGKNCTCTLGPHIRLGWI